MSLITYSGIATKIRAMERWRLTEDDFALLLSQESVLQAVNWLRQIPSYERIFAGMEESGMHRGAIERQLNLAQYQDFAKLYQFANLRQRRFLDLYFMHYEISMIKTCLRQALGGAPIGVDLSVFRSFYERHSKVDLEQLLKSRDINQFIGALRGSPYDPALTALARRGHATLSECENTLDMVYFRYIWLVRKKYLKKKEQEIITQCFGTRMDMLNLQWIWRSKKFYRLSAADIYAVLIPIHLHLTADEIRKLVQAENLEALESLLLETYYGPVLKEGLEQGEDMEALAAELDDRIYQMTKRKDPYSIACLNSFLYFKERETRRIITTLETIRYGVYSNQGGIKT